jgi:hypothetical protein
VQPTREATHPGARHNRLSGLPARPLVEGARTGPSTQVNASDRQFGHGRCRAGQRSAGTKSRGGRPVLMRDCGHGVLKEETQHFSAGIRPPRVGVGAGSTAPRPRVPRSVQDPLLKNRASGFVGLHGSREVHPARRLPLRRILPQFSPGVRLGDDLVPVHRSDGVVPVPVKDNGRDRSLAAAPAVAT